MSEKIRLKGQLKLPVVGKNPTFAQMKFVKVALSEPDILPDSGSIFTCDEQGNYDFEIYTGAHLLSYNVGNAWSKPIEIIAEHLAEGLESIEISDLIGFQEIPELDSTIAALNQQKQELLAIQQDIIDKQAQITSASTNINDTIDDAKLGYPGVVKAMFDSVIYVDAVGGDDSNAGTITLPKKTIAAAVDSVPSSATASISLNATQTHEISSDIKMMSRKIYLTGHGGVSGSRPKIKSVQIESSSSYACGKFIGGTGSHLSINNVDLETVKYTEFKASVLESRHTHAMFSSASASAKISIFYSSAQLNNGDLINEYADAGIGSTDLIFSTLVVDDNVTGSVDDAYKGIVIRQKGAAALPYIIFGYGLALPEGSLLTDYISVNPTNVHTNLAL